MSDFGGEYDDENDWLYVEETYDAADELAEYTCPSPAYFEEGRYGDEYDMFDYFQDLEYLSDGGFYDGKTPMAQSQRKRKLDAGASSQSTKRARTRESSTISTAMPPVVWISNSERNLEARTPTKTKAARGVALLKDWRTRFAHVGGLASFPEGDFQLEADGEAADSDEGSEDEEGDIAGEGFDLDNLQQVAGLIGAENMEALQKLMTAQGLDPQAVQEVMRDMIEGRERADGEEDGDQGEDSEAEQGPDGADQDAHIIAGRPSHGNSRPGARSGMTSIPASNGPPGAHGAKRKAPEEESGDAGPPQPCTKRQRESTSLDGSRPSSTLPSTHVPSRRGRQKPKR